MTMTIDEIIDRLETVVDDLDSDDARRTAALADLHDMSNDLSAMSIQLRMLLDSYAKWHQTRQLFKAEGINLTSSDWKAVELLEQFAKVNKETLTMIGVQS